MLKDNLCSYITGLNSENDRLFFVPSRLLFDEVLEKQNIVTNMKFQIENPLDKVSFNELLPKVIDCR